MARWIVRWLNTKCQPCVCFNVTAADRKEAEKKVTQRGGVVRIISVQERA